MHISAPKCSSCRRVQGEQDWIGALSSVGLWRPHMTKPPLMRIVECSQACAVQVRTSENSRYGVISAYLGMEISSEVVCIKCGFSVTQST